MIIQFYSLFIFLFWTISAQENSLWSTKSKNLERQSFSQNLGPVEVENRKTVSKWFLNIPGLSPLFIVGKSVGFVMLNSSYGYPDGMQLEAFDLQNGALLWTTPLAPANQRIVAAFPPAINPSSNIVACTFTFQILSNPEIHPNLTCYARAGSVVFTRTCPDLVINGTVRPNSKLVISMEFLTADILLITNRGSDPTLPANYLLINVTDAKVVFSLDGIFDTMDNTPVAKPFIPTIVNNQFLYVTNSSVNSEHSVIAFNYTLEGSVSTMWTYKFQNPNFPTTSYDLGLPVFLNLPSTNGLIITSLSPINPYQPGESYLIALDSKNGALMWTQNISKPIIGYAIFIDQKALLFRIIATTLDTISSWNVLPKGLDLSYNYTSPGWFSPPSVDSEGNVYVCENGTITGYNLVGNIISSFSHAASKGLLCDQPIVLDQTVLVRTNIGGSNIDGVLFLELAASNPPANTPGNETGMIVGICIGVLFLLLIILVIIKFRGRRRYSQLN